MTRFRIEDFQASFTLPSRFSVKFRDPGYLEKHVKLLQVHQSTELARPAETVDSPVAVPFTVITESSEAIQKAIPAVDEAVAQHAGSEIRKYLADSYIRVGLLEPIIEFSELRTLVEIQQLVVLVDTNIINLGILDYIVDCRDDAKPILAIVPVTSLLELQKWSDEARPSRRLTKLDEGKLTTTVHRSMGTVAIHHIQRLKERCLVEFIEVDTATLQFFYTEVGKAGTRRDRIIIESIKQVLGQRRFSESPRVLTADKNVAKLLKLENIEAVYVGQPSLPDKIYSVRYNLFRKTYFTASLPLLLWTLAESFGEIRADPLDEAEPGSGLLAIRYIWEDWTLEDWLQRRMEVEQVVSHE